MRAPAGTPPDAAAAEDGDGTLPPWLQKGEGPMGHQRQLGHMSRQARRAALGGQRLKKGAHLVV
jgi:hypothetical protein